MDKSDPSQSDCDPNQPKFAKFRQWLNETSEADQWWVCIDNVTEETPLSLSEIENHLEARQHSQALILHFSQTDKEDPAWQEIATHPLQVHTSEPEPPLLGNSTQKAESKPHLLRDFMEKIAPPSTAKEGNQEGKQAKENRDAAIGCGILIGLLLVSVLLWFFWRPLFRTGGFVIPCAAVIVYAIRKKKLNGCMVVLALVLGIIGFGIIDSMIGVVSSADLKNPPVAIEKIVRSKLGSDQVVEVKVEEGGGDVEGMYFVHVTYHAFALMSEESTLRDIHLTMQNLYTEILEQEELPICYIKIAAQLELQDKFGNEKGWNDVYRTQIPLSSLEKLNRKNLKLVNFERIWEDVYVHPMFSGVR